MYDTTTKYSNRQIKAFQLTGLSLALGGFIYIALQTFHPSDSLAEVGTPLWNLTAILTSFMSLIIFIGLAATFILQLDQLHVMGIVGYAVFALFWLISMIFSFNEAFVLPLLTQSTPIYVEGILSIFGTVRRDVDLGVFPSLAAISGIMYVLGGLIYGFFTSKTGHFRPISALFLGLAALATFGAGLVAHPYNRIFAVPMGLALILLGLEMFQRISRSKSA